MNHHPAILLTALLFAPLASLHAADALDSSGKLKPSVALILAEDRGYGDVGCYWTR